MAAQRHGRVHNILSQRFWSRGALMANQRLRSLGPAASPVVQPTCAPDVLPNTPEEEELTDHVETFVGHWYADVITWDGIVAHGDW
eukprot:5552763-Pyramimonas_sp.AAC.1